MLRKIWNKAWNPYPFRTKGEAWKAVFTYMLPAGMVVAVAAANLSGIPAVVVSAVGVGVVAWGMIHSVTKAHERRQQVSA